MREMHTQFFFSEILKGKDYFVDLDVYDKIILNWILKKRGGIIRNACAVLVGKPEGNQILFV